MTLEDYDAKTKKTQNDIIMSVKSQNVYADWKFETTKTKRFCVVPVEGDNKA